LISAADQHEPEAAEQPAEPADLAMQVGRTQTERERDAADHQPEALVARGLNRVLARKFLVQSGHPARFSPEKSIA
jgi:hypothetical protein